MKLEKSDVYGVGLIYCSVCAPSDMKKEDIAKEVNELVPSGVGPWIMSEDKTFADGTENPTKCNDNKGRIHYLLNC